MKRKLITLTYSIAISIALISMATLVTSCEKEEQDNNKMPNCPSGYTLVGLGTSSPECHTICTNRGNKGSHWIGGNHGVCCCKD